MDRERSSPSPVSPAVARARLKNRRTLSVKVPPGVDTGDRIRLAGEGEAGTQGGAPGDLYVQVHVKPHRLFGREGNDLICEVPLCFTTAALGGDVEIPTLDGRVNIKIPPGTQTGKIFRIRSKGVRPVRGVRAWRHAVQDSCRDPGKSDQAAERASGGTRSHHATGRKKAQSKGGGLAGWCQRVF